MAEPLTTLVVATYNVGRYLPDFLSSLAAQGNALEQNEVLFVNDGATDNSAELIEKWIEKNQQVNARLISQPNAGVCCARNTGLDNARGQWVAFTDPDDVLSSDYLRIVHDFMAKPRQRPVHILACNLQYMDDESKQIQDTHPLRFRFKRGHHHIAELAHRESTIHVSANMSFYKRSQVDSAGLRFDPRVAPVWEDGHFTALYLAQHDRPRVAFLEDAIYQYRVRSDGTSAMQGSWFSRGKYVDVPRHGWLDMLQRVSAARGHVPGWAQNMVLYDLYGYLIRDQRVTTPTATIPEEWKKEFLATIEEVTGFLDPEYIVNYTLERVGQIEKRALLYGIRATDPGPPVAHVVQRDTAKTLVKVLYYYYSAEAPRESFRFGGAAIRPTYAKTRNIELFGRTVMCERTVWLPAKRAISMWLNGVAVNIVWSKPTLPQYSLGPQVEQRQHAAQSFALGGRIHDADDAIARGLRRTTSWRRQVRDDVARLRSQGHTGRELAGRAARKVWRKAHGRGRAGGKPAPDVQHATAQRPRKVSDKPSAPTSTPIRPSPRTRTDDRLPLAVRARAFSAYGKTRYRDCWLLIDRDNQAQDNAERLYEYLRRHQPEINAWFVISDTCTDWQRLHDAGFKLLAHGSNEHLVALLHCTHLVSSQVDEYIVRPFRGILPDGRRTWKFTFLQHGVTHHDLSTWLNSKSIDLLITCSRGEHHAIVRDGSRYSASEKEVKLTGFPRHDRLLNEAEKISTAGRNLLLIMPTWRKSLLLDQVSGGNERHLRDDFWATTYAAGWNRLLFDPGLSEAASEAGLQIVFVPHPNIQGYLWAPDGLPDSISVRRFDTVDVQALIARAAIFVTDYSSLAFEAGYLERPVVYYQFDRHEFYSGAHIFKQGDWSYVNDGFGPVCLEATGVVSEMHSLLDRGCEPEPRYRDRTRATFPHRDGRCSRRVYHAIAALDRPMSRSDWIVNATGSAEQGNRLTDGQEVQCESASRAGAEEAPDRANGGVAGSGNSLAP